MKLKAIVKKSMAILTALSLFISPLSDYLPILGEGMKVSAASSNHGWINNGYARCADDDAALTEVKAAMQKTCTASEMARFEKILSEFPLSGYFNSSKTTACSGHDKDIKSFYDDETGKTIENNLTVYGEAKTTFTRATQCAGFANYCFYRFYGKQVADKSINFKSGYTAQQLKSALEDNKIRAGSHFRWYDGGSKMHSFCYLTRDDTYMYLIDANFGCGSSDANQSNCKIHLKKITYSEFQQHYSTDFFIYYSDTSNFDVPAENPYGQWQTINGVTTVRCTWYAWDQAYQYTGVALPNFGNGGSWYDAAAKAGYSVGTTPREKSIAVYTDSSYGHVAYVVSVNDNDTMVVNEAGIVTTDGQALNGDGIWNGRTRQSVVGKSDEYSSTVLKGFIYLDGTSGGTTPAPSPSQLFDYTVDGKNATITNYNGYSSYVEIPETIDGYTVVAIGSGAFEEKNVIEVVIPDTVTVIEYNTFYNCQSLKKVTIPDTVTEIGNSAFYNCKLLSDVKLPSQLVTLGNGVFYNCKSITSINIPKKLKTSGSYGAFEGCSNLKKVEFEKGISSIIGNLFVDCDGLEEIIIPDTVTVIEYNTFYNCQSLKKVTIPDTVTEIGNSAFYNCKLLSDVKLPSQLVTLGNSVFGNCTSITSINIPKKLKTSGAYGAFYGCSNLKKVEFEKGISSIIDNLFVDCDGLEKVTIPDTVEVIGSSSFRGCTSLTSVTIPESVKTIDALAFQNCTLINNVKLPQKLEIINSSAFSGCSSLTDISIPDTVTSIGSGCFEDCTSLKTVKLPNKIKEISAACFQNCSSLESIDIPDTVENISGLAFGNCTSLEKVNLTEKSSLKRIYYAGYGGAFENCEKLKEIILPETVEFIGIEAFLNCSSLAKVYIPKSVKTIEKSAFEGCSSLTDLTISDGSIEKIENETFKGCSSLKSVVLPRGLQSIGEFAFMNNVDLTSVTIPPSVTEIDSTAFSYPGKMTIYGYEGTYAEEFAKQEEITFVPLKKIPFDKLTVELGETFEYTGNQITPEISVFEGEYRLTEDQEYTVTYGENIKIGKGTVTITLIGPMYEGTKTVEFSIVPADINSAKYTPSDNKFTYFGKDLVEGVDYTVEYVYDLDAMCTDMIFTGIGNFTGKHTVYSYSTANPLCSFENGASDFAFDDVLERWRMDFSIADQSVWSKVDKIEAVIFSEGGYVNGCIGYVDMSGEWQMADFERLYGSYGYYTFSAKNVGGLISGPDEYGNEMGNLCFQLWWIEKYTNFYLTSLTLYDKEGKVLVRLPELKNYLVYETDKNNEVSVLGASLASETEPEIPAEIGGNTVTSIGEKAFAGKSGLASVTIPLTVTQIAKNAFDGRSEQFAIRGYVDSYAKTYADENNIPFIPIKDLSDKDHGVGLEDTEELIPDGAELVVEEVKSSEDGQTTVYDITLVDGSGAEVEPDGDVLVIIDLPQKWANVDKVYVYYCTENGTLVDMNAYIFNGYIMFTTSHFSQYMLTTKNQTTVKLGDVDGNGKINALDNMTLAKYIANGQGSTVIAIADMNGDGKVNALDNMILAQNIANGNV